MTQTWRFLSILLLCKNRQKKTAPRNEQAGRRAPCVPPFFFPSSTLSSQQTHPCDKKKMRVLLFIYRTSCHPHIFPRATHCPHTYALFFCILHILPLLCHCSGSSYRCCDSLLGLFDRSPCTVRDLGRTFFESWASIMRATYLFAGLARVIGRQTFSPCLWMNRCNFNNLPSVFISAIRSASGFGSRGSWRSQETTWFGRAKGRYS